MAHAVDRIEKNDKKFEYEYELRMFYLIIIFLINSKGFGLPYIFFLMRLILIKNSHKS